MKNLNKFKITSSMLLMTYLFSGCSVGPSIKEIETKEYANSQANIHISKKGGFEAFINNDDELDYISTNIDSYNNKGKDIVDYFYFNNSGYYPPFSADAKNVQCGVGSLLGWVAVLSAPFFIKDINKDDNTEDFFDVFRNYDYINSHVCKSKFASLDKTQISMRIFTAMGLFGTSLVTAGTMHTEKFDKDYFVNYINSLNIESFRDKLISKVNDSRARGIIDVIYLSEDDMDDDLLDKYEELLDSEDKRERAGVVFLQKDSNKLIDIVIFNAHSGKDILDSISMQVTDILDNASHLQKVSLSNDDIISYIPSEIAVPKLPPVKQLTKDEFETKDAFKQRVQKSVEDRENSIKQLQRKYSDDIYSRNTYIDNLQIAYKQYLQDNLDDTNSYIQEMNKNIPMFLKLLFLENISGYTANNFEFDAETNKLYFTIKSIARDFKQDVVATVPVESAKRIKQEEKFKIKPIIKSSKNEIVLSGFKLIDQYSDNEYDTKYTDIDFTPSEIKVSRATNHELIDKELSVLFKKQKQKDIPIVDNTQKEVWYVDIVDRMNAKVPKWFSEPIAKNTTLGYGSGKSLEEAKLNAKKDLALMMKTQISVSVVSTTKSNNFKTFNEIESSIKEQSNAKLDSSNYSVFKQEYVDGNWYVALES